jgi:hypothetical protein
MKTRNTTTKLITIAIALSAMAAIWAAWGANQMVAKASPKDAQTVSYGTGVYSLARGQATSAHVVNTGDERGIEVNWRVLDSAGNVHAQSDRRMVELGHASSFDFGPLDLAEGERMPIRVELMVEGASRNKPGFIATQEVYNIVDSKTTVFLPYIEQ